MTTLTERITTFNAPLLPDMVVLKYKAMRQNAFRFFRGTCHLFYEDLWQAREHFPESPAVWSCGDLHLENFGSYKANDRQVYFDLNDFDEAMLAPLNWELARLLTSIHVAFAVLGLQRTTASDMAASFLNTYTRTLATGKAYCTDPRTAGGIVHTFLHNIRKRTETALISKITVPGSRKHRIQTDHSAHFGLEAALKNELLQHVTDLLKASRSWQRHYRAKDAAFRLAGTGSIGLKRYMLLLQHHKHKKAFLLTELKQARTSSLAPYNPVVQPEWTSDAARIITAKYRMQYTAPALLDTTEFRGETYVFQEMQPYEDKLRLEVLADNLKDLKTVLTDMAVLTASSHIRSSGISGSAINDTLTSYAADNRWHTPLLDYAEQYARQVQADYRSFLLLT